LAVPFLAKEHQVRREIRSRKIEQECYGYYAAIDKLRPILENIHLLPPGAKLPDLPEKPSSLEQWERVERWGFPNPGTWLDQPAEYMEDVEAARRGKERYVSELEARKQAQQDLSRSSQFPPALPINLAG